MRQRIEPGSRETEVQLDEVMLTCNYFADDDGVRARKVTWQGVDVTRVLTPQQWKWIETQCAEQIEAAT